MIYRSNLTCPDLTPHFRHLHSRVMPHSFGHDVPSDWADKADDDPVFGLYKRCGMWTHDEAAILYNVARKTPGAVWVDVGAHTGWTTAHLSCAGHETRAVDPMLRLRQFGNRLRKNLGMRVTGEAEITQFGYELIDLGITSSEYIADQDEDVRDNGPCDGYFSGFCIDGDHEPGEPLKDAQGAARHLGDTGVIIFHDFIGQPVREAVTWLMQQGFHARVYMTPHMVACCWRGDFTPPDHVPDPNLPNLKARCPEFDWSRCE